MSLQESTIESGLAALKAVIDETDAHIKHLSSEADDLKPSVTRYNKLKQEAAELKKKRKASFRELLTITEFIQKATGHFPDGMFPLFSQENTGNAQEQHSQ